MIARRRAAAMRCVKEAPLCAFTRAGAYALFHYFLNTAAAVEWLKGAADMPFSFLADDEQRTRRCCRYALERHDTRRYVSEMIHAEFFAITYAYRFFLLRAPRADAGFSRLPAVLKATALKRRLFTPLSAERILLYMLHKIMR